MKYTKRNGRYDTYHSSGRPMALDLSEREFAALVERCRERGVTVTDVDASYLSKASAMYARRLNAGLDADEAEQAVAAKYGAELASRARSECVFCD